MVMKLKKISFKEVSYKKLNSKQKEIRNFQTVAGLLAKYGFNCIKLSDDWQGADFLAYHIDRKTTLKIQLKSRLEISRRKYKNKEIFIAFPMKGGTWYLIDHDTLVVLVGKTTDWLKTKSWRGKNGGYSSQSLNPELIEAINEYGFKIG
jgi:hypothetical protein